MEKLELFKIFLTSGLTITGGVLIFVLGQMILKFVIEPIHEFNKLKGEIAYSLVFYANVYMNVPLSYTDLSEDRQDRDKAQQVFLDILGTMKQLTSINHVQFLDLILDCLFGPT